MGRAQTPFAAPAFSALDDDVAADHSDVLVS